MYNAHSALGDLQMVRALADLTFYQKELLDRAIRYLNQQKIKENIPEVCREKYKES